MNPGYGLNMRELLIGDFTRMAHVYRFSTVLCMKRESSAEHTFFTSWISFVISHYVKQKGMHVSLGEVLTKCLVHDLEECRTGDINRLFKYSSHELRQAIDRSAYVMLGQTLDKMFDQDNEMTFEKSVLHHWRTSKDDTVEGRIVKFADFLSVLSYMWAEVRFSNQTMFRYHDDVAAYAAEFNDPSFDFIRELVVDAQEIVEKVLSSPENRRPFEIEER